MPILDYFRRSAGPPPGEPLRYSALALAALVFGALLVPVNCSALLFLVPDSFKTPPMWHLALLYGDYLFFALTPGSLGVMAIVRITRPNSGLTGEYFACVGIFVSMLLLIPVCIKVYQMLF